LAISPEREHNTRSNVPEFSVGDLAFSLKKTLEENFARVRVRGELSRVSIAGSGHMYSSLKDDHAVIDAVCWKGVMAKLSITPEEGMEVIITGRVTTYPQRSNYQLIVENMELAGEGALLKMLEERKKKLAAEGLFDAERKRPLPFLPTIIGVVTSPTGAVIRDILHRLADRFPRHVQLWPVLVQGQGAAEQIANAIHGFNALEQKPDLLIVARGGGSLEDLMPFNEENVVRAVADSLIPVISEVGHETDTTLCDYAADLRAPTPTGAAEMAVPVRANLYTQILDYESRLVSGMNRQRNEYRLRLDNLSTKLGNPDQLLEIQAQRLDNLDRRLAHIFSHFLTAKQSRVNELSAMIRHPQIRIDEADKTLNYHGAHLKRLGSRLLDQKHIQLNSLGRMLDTLSYENILARGFVVVKDHKGKAILDPATTKDGQNIELQYSQGRTLHATLGTGSATYGFVKKPRNTSYKKVDSVSNVQKSLFD